MQFELYVNIKFTNGFSYSKIIFIITTVYVPRTTIIFSLYFTSGNVIGRTGLYPCKDLIHKLPYEMDTFKTTEYV